MKITTTPFQLIPKNENIRFRLKIARALSFSPISRSINKKYFVSTSSRVKEGKEKKCVFSNAYLIAPHNRKFIIEMWRFTSRTAVVK
jgi:hypothetical protein